MAGMQKVGKETSPTGSCELGKRKTQLNFNQAAAVCFGGIYTGTPPLSFIYFFSPMLQVC